MGRKIRKPPVSNEVIIGYSDSPEMTFVIFLLWKRDLDVSFLGAAGNRARASVCTTLFIWSCILVCPNCVISPQKACFNIFRWSTSKLLPGWQYRVQAVSATLLLFLEKVYPIAQASLRLPMHWCWLWIPHCPALPPKSYSGSFSSFHHFTSTPNAQPLVFQLPKAFSPSVVSLFIFWRQSVSASVLVGLKDVALLLELWGYYLPLLSHFLKHNRFLPCFT